MPCTKGPDGGPAPAVERVGGQWYCQGHIGGAKAALAKRRDEGFGTCSIPGCTRPAAGLGEKCKEHRAGERAARATALVTDEVTDEATGKGGHPYAPKQTEIYLVVFSDPAALEVGKAMPWTVGDRVRDAVTKAEARLADSGNEGPISFEAWAVRPFGDHKVGWAEGERLEHAVAGRLARNVGATPAGHLEGKELFDYEALAEVDWTTEFDSAVRETLTFNGILLAGDERSLWTLLALLNSRLLDYYFRRLSVAHANGYFAANKQFIAPLPIHSDSPEAQLDQLGELLYDRASAISRERNEFLDWLGGQLGTDPAGLPGSTVLTAYEHHTLTSSSRCSVSLRVPSASIRAPARFGSSWGASSSRAWTDLPRSRPSSARRSPKRMISCTTSTDYLLRCELSVDREYGH